jgi:glyoxylase-like metal-dependent hydrolase (beta-lactamase superfamily II)
VIQTSQTVSIQVGGYQAHPIPTGIFGLDGGAMFGTVPKVLWSKTNPSDEMNRIPMEARALLLISKDKKILIDTGNGSDFIEKYGEVFGKKFQDMYAIDENGPSLMKSLNKYNITADDITDVILTHFHFDHAGGATKAENGKIVPTFKNATYYIQKANLNNALNPNKREKSSYLKQNIEPLIESKKLVVLESDSHPDLKNIKFFISNGHTEGHQSVIISDDQNQLIYCGDLIATSTHIRSAWVMGYDLDALQIMEEKKIALQMSQTKKTYYFFEHDPYCDMATVIPDKDDFKVEERYWLK